MKDTKEVRLGGKIKKVQDVVRYISRDFEEVNRGAIITFEVPDITEENLRRLQRVALNGHVVLAELFCPQLGMDDFEETFADAGSEVDQSTANNHYAIGQEVVVLKTGELGTVNDTSPGGVLVKLGGEDSGGDLVPLAIHEVKLR